MRTAYLFDNPKPCPECGKAAAKYTTNEWYSSAEMPRGEMPPYNGNQIVLRKGHRHRVLWDGETYIQKYGYFCSLNCTSAYANKMVKRFGR